MPATVRKVGGVNRVVDRKPSGDFGITKGSSGKAVDGGPKKAAQRSKASLQSQARAINARGSK
jgi:hypothetical protein